MSTAGKKRRTIWVANRSQFRWSQSRREHPRGEEIMTQSTVAGTPFDFAPLLAAGLPAPAIKWNGFPKYNFVGGHNDAAHVPVDELIAAAAAVLKREGRTLATYGLESGPLGYLRLREFLVEKLKRDAGISCAADEILITSGSLQAIDLINALLLNRGDTVVVEKVTYFGSLHRTRARRRRQLLALAQAHGVPIFEDDCYADLIWDGKRPPALYALSERRDVIHI